MFTRSKYPCTPSRLLSPKGRWRGSRPFNRPDLCDEIFTAGFETVVLVKTRRSRGEQDHVARLALRIGGSDCRLHRGAYFAVHIKLHGKSLGLTANHIGLLHMPQGRLQRREPPLLLQSSTDPADIVKCAQRFECSVDIRGLTVIHKAHPGYLTNHLATMRQACETAKPLFNHPRRHIQSAQHR